MTRYIYNLIPDHVQPHHCRAFFLIKVTSHGILDSHLQLVP
jgi:hypothetical protein